MRSKSNAVEYCYFTEPNILAIKLDNKFVFDAINSMNKTPDVITSELKELKVNDKLINQLLDDFSLYSVFNKVANATKDSSQAVT
ncbi:MAG: hypothetical protein K2L48_00785 [Mycoplasmoidaceae bacterium]|nr:hypothetical protein [Mycoplasmoidaceae bacterium]